MNKEQHQIMMESYRQYSEKCARKLFKSNTYQEFINKCKTNPEFSENWELKIEERELNYEERIKLFKEKTNRSLTYTLNVRERLDENGIPTKLITITYNNQTIESYE